MMRALVLLVALGAAPAAAGQSVGVSLRHDVALSHPMAGVEGAVRLGAGQLRAGAWHGGRVTPEPTFCLQYVGAVCPPLSRHGSTTEVRLGWTVENEAPGRVRVYAGPHLSYLRRASEGRTEGERVGQVETGRAVAASGVAGLRWQALGRVALSAEAEVGAERVLSSSDSPSPWPSQAGRKRTFARFVPSVGVAVALR